MPLSKPGEKKPEPKVEVKESKTPNKSGFKEAIVCPKTGNINYR